VVQGGSCVICTRKEEIATAKPLLERIGQMTARSAYG
jgi:hypothetical protein